MLNWYIESYDNIINITPEENYDEYCKNKLNNSLQISTNNILL